MKSLNGILPFGSSGTTAAILTLECGVSRNRRGRTITLIALLLTCSICAAANRTAPESEAIHPGELLPALEAQENFRSQAGTIRRGLRGSQMTYRAESAQWFIKHGTIDDVPYLIDALSDESQHEGAKYPVAGMATTRYWANVALIVICKTSFDFQWDADREKREYSIQLWKQHWNRINPKTNQ